MISSPPTASTSGRPKPYHRDLIPLPSPLRPHVPAKDRLKLWLPPISCRRSSSAGGGVTEADIARVQHVLSFSWADNTLGVYGTGLLVFHVFCDHRNITEDQRVPATPILISSFISALAGSYTMEAIKNYVYGVRAWHILHGLQWKADDDTLDALLRGAAALTPPSSRRPQRAPITVEFLRSIQPYLDLTRPLDAAFWACLLVSFFCTARLGEFTVPNQKAFDPQKHVKRSDMRVDFDRNNLKSTVFHLPRTKTSPGGEDVSFSKQEVAIDPEAALSNHFEVNNPPNNAHLFSYRNNANKFAPMTRSKFLARLRQVAELAGLQYLPGHSIRIGSTLEYLLRGIPFEAMKTKGRWSSDAFQIYLTRHAQILAPYMQAIPILQEQVIRSSIPAVRRHS